MATEVDGYRDRKEPIITVKWINNKAKGLKQGTIRAMFDRANKMSDVISLGIGEPDMPTPKLICDACKEALDKGITHYTPNAGMFAFRQAIAEKTYLKDLRYDPNTEIIVTNGGMGALSLLFLVLLNDGDEILIQDPDSISTSVEISSEFWTSSSFAIAISTYSAILHITSLAFFPYFHRFFR